MSTKTNHGIFFAAPVALLCTVGLGAGDRQVLLTREDIAFNAEWKTPSPMNEDGPGHVSYPLYTAEIVLDTDYEFFLFNGSDVNATEQAAMAFVDAANPVFIAGPGVQFVVTDIVVRTDPNDPYTSTNIITTFSEFRQVWSGSPTPHDVAVLISGKSFDNGSTGLAGIDGLCNPSNNIAVIDGTVSQPIVYAVFKHLVGHIFGAPHCDGAGCNIMCQLVGGCSGNTDSFSTSSISAMENLIATAGSCLDPVEQPCNPADIAEPFGVLDLQDISAFISAFTSGCP
ncbi:MAG TPA: hypothetical protein ENK11_10615 [Phycisphaerales bacterium]|nr:hypothetical protein [Phycisphaerales bacterium]